MHGTENLHESRWEKPKTYVTMVRNIVAVQSCQTKHQCKMSLYNRKKKKMATTVAKGNTRTKPNILFCYTQADHSTVKNILQKTSLWYDLVKWLLHLQHQSNKKQLSEDCYASNWQDNPWGGALEGPAPSTRPLVFIALWQTWTTREPQARCAVKTQIKAVFSYLGKDSQAPPQHFCAPVPPRNST